MASAQSRGMNSVKCGARRSTYQSPSADSQRRHDATSNRKSHAVLTHDTSERARCHTAVAYCHDVVESVILPA